MAEPLRRLADDLTAYLNDNVLTSDTLDVADTLDALASLGLTLVEDPIGDSSVTYFESLTAEEPEQES